MGTKVLIPKSLIEQNGGKIDTITGFISQIIEDRGSVYFVEFKTDLTAGEKTTLNTNLQTKVANYVEVSK